jgi:hypothetical protein
VGLEDDTVVVEGAEGRGDDRAQIRLPPALGVGGADQRVGRERFGALGEGGAEEGGRTGGQMRAQAVADQYRQLLEGEVGGAVAAVAQPGARQVGEGRGDRRVRAAQFKQVVAPQATDVVGDAHVQAELEEEVGLGDTLGTEVGGAPGTGSRSAPGNGRRYVHRPDRRSRPHLGLRPAQPYEPAVGECVRQLPAREVELPGVGGQEAVAGWGRAQGVEGGGVALLDHRVLADAEQFQREAGVRLGRVRQPGGGRATAAGLGGGVVRVPGDQGLLGADVRVLGCRRPGAGGEDGGHGLAAVEHLGGEFGVGQAGEEAQFLGGEFDQFRMGESVPGAVGEQFGVRGAACALHAQQASAGRETVHTGVDGLRRLPQETVEQGRGGEGVGGPADAVIRGVGVHGVHSFHTVHS